MTVSQNVFYYNPFDTLYDADTPRRACTFYMIIRMLRNFSLSRVVLIKKSTLA